MTPYLEQRGVEVTESDLGGADPAASSGVLQATSVVSAINNFQGEGAALFTKDIGTASISYSKPHHLAEADAARMPGRDSRRGADAGGPSKPSRIGRNRRVRGLYE